MWLNGCNFHILCQHHAKLDENRHSASGDIMLLICHVNQDQTFLLGEFEERNDRSKLTNLNNRDISRLNGMQKWISQMDKKNPLKWKPKPARCNSNNLYALFCDYQKALPHCRPRYLIRKRISLKIHQLLFENSEITNDKFCKMADVKIEK